MYDFPEVRPHVERLWRAVRDGMRRAGLENVPEHLSHLSDDWDAHWASRRLFVSQICGVDVVKRFRDRYRVLATPRFSAPGCVEHCYRSLVVVRSDAPYREVADLRGARLAVNSVHSHSGSTSLVPLVAPLCQGGQFFGSQVVSGSHENSLAMVSRGEASVAAVDCISFAILARERVGAVRDVRVLAQTPPAPAPPFVAPASHGEAALESMRAALFGVFEEPALQEARQALFLGGLEQTDEASYAPILDFLAIGERHGYEELSAAYRSGSAPGGCSLR